MNESAEKIYLVSTAVYTMSPYGASTLYAGPTFRIFKDKAKAEEIAAKQSTDPYLAPGYTSSKITELVIE